MQSNPIRYDDFRASNQGFGDSGGPWETRFVGDPDSAQCGSTRETWCDGVCLECRIYPPAEAGTYHLTYITNISVNMAQYGEANSLDFTWSYWPLYTGSNIQSGSLFPIRSQISDISYNDTMISTDFSWFHGGAHSWIGSPMISHNGTVTVNRGLDSNIGYIGIVIYYEPKATSHTETINHFIKDINFNITTPMQTTAPMATPVSSKPSQSGQVIGAVVINPNLQNSQQPTIPIAAIAGAAVGSVVLVALFVIAFVLYRRKRRNIVITHLEEQNAIPTAYPFREQGRPSNAISLVDVPFAIPSVPDMSSSTPHSISSTNPTTSPYSTSLPSMAFTRAQARRLWASCPTIHPRYSESDHASNLEPNVSVVVPP
ncbi:hypothetical protein M408DRAFT_25567 [Serendipita vermifera MAFF 305830]|uniref:Uncharacterized protein n=1 Tax=Serendipita vermifera MAFF 305830 TaxID=933852 RepID=A0A0C2XAC6_SERVB|nr:hypothetical protein M408DRAFT_25567 [Serendipita vermifera MAFF 305830]